MSYHIEGHKVICDDDVERTYLELWIGDKGYGHYICPRCKSDYKVFDYEFVEEPNRWEKEER